MTQVQRLLVLDFPLHGSRLIEASAGTGKTYTIAALYVRLVLQHGSLETAFKKHLLPPDILVVTFTEAATQELRDRIRSRLAQAARVFRGQEEADAFLAELKQHYPESEWSSCAVRLDLAAQWMDESAIQTIHGWCQRMLREHAFASGALFTQEVQSNHAGLYLQVVKDYWRQQCYPLEGVATRWVATHWQQPERLWEQLSKTVQATEVGLPEGQATSLQEILTTQLEQRRVELAELKAAWSGWLDELEKIVVEAIQNKEVDGRKLQEKRTLGWLQSIRDWCAALEQAVPELTDAAINRLSPEGWQDAWKKGLSAPSHAAIDAMPELMPKLKALEAQVADNAFWHAANWVRTRFAHEKQNRAEMGFNDMLLNLQRALKSSQGAALAAMIRQQFPVAMIDEFQDTDPIQYDIFNRIYHLADNDPNTGIFLIGDPKQAIYSFRGADIYTYLQAKEDTQNRHYSLDTNFRSSVSMVEAVNQLFLMTENQQPSGAFLFKSKTDNPLPFIEVKAQGRKERWVVEGKPQPALTFWRLPPDVAEGLNKTGYHYEMAQRCASQIVQLLSQPNTGYERDGELIPVSPADIAVLVRDRHEAQAIRDALLARAVRSVYLSDKDSVYASEQAADMQFWLLACLHSEDERSVKAALATQTFCMGLDELHALQADELTWEAHTLRFRRYQQVWQEQGILPMLRQLMHEYQLPQRLLHQAQGERALTNLLHLAEILQQASRELDGQLALLEYLQHACAEPDSAADDQILRLESDAQLVRVVTIHKSKGLEYPLVFLPFVCSYRPARLTKGQLVSVQGRRFFCDDPSDEQLLADVERERLAEDLRLLYVAVTRAQHACWLGVTEISKQDIAGSALGYVLGGSLEEGMQQLQSDCISVQWAPEINPQAWEPDEELFTPEYREAQKLRHEPWWIASYSALQTGSTYVPAPDSQMAQVLVDDEPDMLAELLVRQDVAGVHSFPRGAGPGTFLHHLIEAVMSDEQALQIGSTHFFDMCEQAGFAEYAEMLEQWMQQLFTQHFQLPDGAAFQLGHLEQWRNEMEFWFSSQCVSAQALDKLVQESILPRQPRPAVLPNQLNGLFKGFIDLVFVADGRYYIADYKSNWLGATSQHYTRQAMDDCVLKHRYDLQYSLYTLALHRLLKSRLPNYSYDEHVGGVVYLFLRGIAGQEQGVHFVKPPFDLICALDALFSGAAGEDV